MKTYFAHRIEDTDERQTVAAHLTGTAELAERFASAFGAGALGRRCGLLHDIGKYTDAFQRRLLNNGPRVDHSTAGMRESIGLSDLFSAFCIAGHHGGLPNGGNPKTDTAQDGTLAGRMKKQLEDYSAFAQEITPPNAPVSEPGDPFSDAFFIRMLYSCLVDADFLDTEHFMSRGQTVRGAYDGLDVLSERLTQYIEPWWNAKTPLNRRRCAILRACIRGGAQALGLFSLTVPTGGGKTVSSMAFALAHAQAHGLRRIVYIIPYTSIIEQTADTFSKIFGGESVLAHYATADFQDDQNDAVSPLMARKRLAAENWDAPIILTTAVQFFESLYANKPSRCRKLHNIARSVLIFDEAQMLPTPYLLPCLRAITQLTAQYGCSAVLCTATQPALTPLLPAPPRELCPHPAELYNAFRRVRYTSLGTLSDDALAQRLRTHPQVLCIVNSRGQAQRVFSSIADEEGTFHLSTLMTPVHRKETLAAIRRRLDLSLPCRVVATSLIEAGVDVDFPTVYHAMAGLDSILQAGGRCNRENKRPPDSSIVYLFRPETPPPPIFSQQIDAAEAVLRTCGDPAAPEAIHRYFTYLLYTLKDRTALDTKQICRQFETAFFPFADVAAQFHLIETNARTIYVLPADGRLLRELEQAVPSRSLLRRLGPYAVSVYPQHFASLSACGAVEMLWEDIAVLRDAALYNARIGLSLDTDEGQGKFA